MHMQRTTSGAAGNGLYTTIKCMHGAAGIGVGTTIKHLRRTTSRTKERSEQKGRRIASLQAPRSKRIAVPFIDDCGTVSHLV